MIFDKARFFLFSWRVILRACVIAIPLLASSVLGLLWLSEHAYLLEFSLACLALGVFAYIALRLPIWLSKPQPEKSVGPDKGPHVSIDPDWSASEVKAFTAGKNLINTRLTSPLESSELQGFAMDVITAVAGASGDRGKTPFDFSIPEALLLVERVASRLRTDLKSHASISDRVSVKTLLWIWKNQDRARRAYDIGQGAYRISRFATSFPTAIARELLDLITSGNKQLLTTEMLVIGQRILFEEVAKAATELYSGRLRMSDTELLDCILAESQVNRKRLAEPDAPLRIAIAGQISSGKSSLVNALLGHAAAETDMPPTTDRPTVFEGEIDGAACQIIDLPGIDGSQASAERTLKEAQQCDILIWALPVNRPARETDRALIAAIKDEFAKEPLRRAPPILGVATFCDRLADAAWPFPEHQMPVEIQGKIGEAVRIIGDEVGVAPPVPVSLAETPWNTAAVSQEVAKRIFDGINVQRNRIRLTRDDKSIARETIDTVQGLTRGLRGLGKHAAARYWGKT